MKVRLQNLAVLTAMATGASAVAQAQEPGEGGSLERALADLNAGRVAPPGAAGTVSASGSRGLAFSGDARIRNTWLNEIGAVSDMKNVDARLRFNAAFDVSEDASAFMQLVAYESWGFNPFAYNGSANAATGEAVITDTGSISQAYFQGRNVVFQDEQWTFGRQYYTIGSGRILGTDEWDQGPDSFSGVWYEHPLWGWNLDLFMITDAFNAGGVNGRMDPFGRGDTDLFGATFSHAFEELEMLGTIHFKPYILRMTTQDAATGTKNWYGAELAGAWEAIDWDVEAVWVDSDRPSDPSLSSYNAWAVDLGVHLDRWFDVPGGINPRIELAAAAADKAGVTIDPVYHNVAGIYDFQNRAGAPGVWGGEADTYQGAVALTPYQGWDARVAYIHFNDNNETNAIETDANEIDLSVSHTFHNNVSMWLGWARVDVNGADPSAYVVYGTLGLPF